MNRADRVYLWMNEGQARLVYNLLLDELSVTHRVRVHAKNSGDETSVYGNHTDRIRTLRNALVLAAEQKGWDLDEPIEPDPQRAGSSSSQGEAGGMGEWAGASERERRGLRRPSSYSGAAARRLPDH